VAWSQTSDLCTRYGTALDAVGPPHVLAAISPTVYIDQALADDPHADARIRAAVGDAVRLMRERVAALSTATPGGAVVLPPLPWRADAMNAATQQAWDLCTQAQP
jgi:hypothetical protein